MSAAPAIVCRAQIVSNERTGRVDGFLVREDWRGPRGILARRGEHVGIARLKRLRGYVYAMGWGSLALDVAGEASQTNVIRFPVERRQ